MSDNDLLPADATPIAEAPIAEAPIAEAPATVDPLVEPPTPPTPAEPPADRRSGPAADRGSGPPAHRRAGLLGRLRDERGEGVISAAIAVLIMAFIGVAAFVAYRGIMGSVTEKTTQCVDVYVSNGSGCD